ncbi:MAG: DNA polymerase III [Treponema sp.]|nr:DNA polymerase III [Treponema sp.]
MFENIIEQGAVLQLRDDILSGRDAPSMLFFGPSGCGKGSAALELARVLSCEKNGDWKCSCSSCERHRFLQHDDLLIIGSRSFSSDISACRSAFLRNPSSQSAKLLFFRSLRKLQLRFSPVILENDSKTAKAVSGVLQSLDEGLNDFLMLDTGTCEKAVMEKLCNSLIKDALKLEDEGLSDTIPINNIRSASSWCRLAPGGKRKTLIIENAENMRDDSRNSLLKLLEEPPATVSIVLNAQRREAIIPTILSRVRPYRFLKRSAEGEKEVIRRIFQDKPEESILHEKNSLLNSYLDSFLTQNDETMRPLAAWFIVSLARAVSLSFKKNNIPAAVYALGERYAPVCETAGIERCVKSAGVVKIIHSKSNNFEFVSFSGFMRLVIELVNTVTREADNPAYIACNEIFKKYINEAVTAVDVLNINSTITLEALFYKLKTALRGQNG